MKLTLSENNLCKYRQYVTFNKVTALIGENGAGKSSILQSIFKDRLENNQDLENKKIVCFSSGQNENYSKDFSEYLSRERQSNRGLNLGCCYYDKLWSKLLIFLATMEKEDGRVRGFLSGRGYIELSEDQRDDLSSSLTVHIRVEKPYVNRVKDALKEEENGEAITFRISSYHRTLESFIQSIVDENYEFEVPLFERAIILNTNNFFLPEFISSDEAYFEPKVTFFTQAADNDYFFKKDSIQLNFKNEIELNDLSDGEYQLLFIYALIDLFDSEETLFLLDEVDSHLHYKNIENLWNALHEIKGDVITTTHLLDSITSPKNGFDALQIIEGGVVRENLKMKAIIERLSSLSRMTSVHFNICSKVEHIVLMDDYNDWIIFLTLAKRKGLNIESLSKTHVIKKESGYNSYTESFGKAKIEWVENFLTSTSERATQNIFLICDKDVAPIKFKNDGVTVEGLKIQVNKLNSKSKSKNHILAWQRREIKNYLLSYTALSEFGMIEKVNNTDEVLKKHFLRENDAGDNRSIRGLNVKSYITQLIDTKGIGLDIEKLENYVSHIPPKEISVDIENMYRYIVDKIR